MSFLETSKSRFDWIATQPFVSLRVRAGCVQCGSGLEMNEKGQYDATGKCFNCMNWVSDEDEDVTELED